MKLIESTRLEIQKIIVTATFPRVAILLYQHNVKMMSSEHYDLKNLRYIVSFQ